MTATATTLLQRLGAFTVDAHHALPEDVAVSVERRTLDILGLCLAALELPTSAAAIGFAADQGGSDQAAAIGLGRTSASWAAFVNGVLAHSLDYDDTHLPSILHPSASVIPAALAMAERQHRDGDRLVPAIAAGLEICVRLGMAGYDRKSNNSVYFEHGQHATSICGAVGAAAAAAALIGDEPDAQLITDAMGIAISMAGGVIEANRSGGTVKRMHCGWAAHAGVTAAGLAAAGITGPPTGLEGRFGFFQAFLQGNAALHEVTDGLGEQWEVPKIFFKPYPANHFTHTIVDAGRQLAERGVTPDRIASAHIGVAGPIVRTLGEPLAIKQQPTTSYQAQFSGPYALAVGLFGGGGLGSALEDYTDELAVDPARRRLMGTVTVGADARCDAIYPYQFPSVVTVRTVEGDEVEVAVLVNRGGSENPLTADELGRKFHDNAARVVDDETIAQVAHRVGRLRSESDLPGLLGLLARPAVPTDQTLGRAL